MQYFYSFGNQILQSKKLIYYLSKDLRLDLEF